MLKPALALLDETDSGLDVDAVKTVASGIKAYHNTDNALIIITHNAKILEGSAGRLRPCAGRRPHRPHRRRQSGQ